MISPDINYIVAKLALFVYKKEGIKVKSEETSFPFLNSLCTSEVCNLAEKRKGGQQRDGGKIRSATFVTEREETGWQGWSGRSFGGRG